MFFSKQSPRDQIEKLIAANKYDKAIPLLIGLYRSKLPLKERCRIGSRLAEVYIKAGNKESALDLYREVSATYAKEGFLIQAIAMTKIILTISPFDEGTKALLVKLYSQRGIDYKPDQPAARKARTIPDDDHLPPPTPFMEIEAEPELVEPVAKDIDEIKRAQLQLKHQLPRYPLFSELSESEFAEVLKQIERKDYEAGEVLFRTGEPADALFVISEGEVLVYTESQAFGRNEIKRLESGDFFGEFGLLSNTTRHACCMATVPSVLLRISKHDFDLITARYPRVHAVLESFYRSRVLDTLAAESLIFRNIEATQRKEIIDRFSMKLFKTGEAIVREGEKSTSFYFIKSGLVEISRAQDGQKKVLSVFKPGMFFGEVAMLTGSCRTATATCLQNSEVYEMSKNDFEQIASKYPLLHSRLSEIAALRAPGEAAGLMKEDPDDDIELCESGMV